MNSGFDSGPCGGGRGGEVASLPWPPPDKKKSLSDLASTRAKRGNASPPGRRGSCEEASWRHWTVSLGKSLGRFPQVGKELHCRGP